MAPPINQKAPPTTSQFQPDAKMAFLALQAQGIIPNTKEAKALHQAILTDDVSGKDLAYAYSLADKAKDKGVGEKAAQVLTFAADHMHDDSMDQKETAYMDQLLVVLKAMAEAQKKQ